MMVLKQRQDEFDQITGNMREALVLLDHADKIVSINPAAEKLFAVKSCSGTDFLNIDRKQNMRLALEDAKEVLHFERKRMEGYISLN